MPFVNPSARQFKNSGWLRYRFGVLGYTRGEIPVPMPDPDALPGLVGGAAAVIFTCLGADLDVTPDADVQIFGESPGHAAIPAVPLLTGSLFDGFAVAQRNATPVGNKVQGDPNTGAAPAGGSRAGARIPAGSKVRAYFVPSGITRGLGGGPDIVVQQEVIQNRMFRGGVEDAAGPAWLSSIRVAIMNVGAADSVSAGTLWVDLQHSHLDIPATGGLTMVDVP